MKIGTGKAHCSPNGILYAHCESIDNMDRSTMDATNWPITQHALTYL